MNTGTAGGRMETRVGDNCLFMTGAHVGHDCIVGNNVIFANCATLGGHVEVGDFTFMGGFGAMIQFGKIGEQAMIGGMAAVRRDVIPFGLTGANGTLDGLNLVGMKRRGFSRSDVQTLRAAYDDLFFGRGTFAERLESVAAAYSTHAGVQKIVSFVRAAGKRGVSTPVSSRGSE
jgi:UDP-N-acetylglucosamine acyltransferase